MNISKVNLSSSSWYVFVFFILTKAFAGPLGLFFPYIRFFPVLLMFTLMIIKIYQLASVRASFIILLSALALYVFIGTANNSIFASLFGMYIFIPFAFSFLFHNELISKILSKDNTLNLFLLLTCSIGIIYVNIYGGAWIGAEQEIGGVTKEISKSWSSDGVIRNPGFTSGSVTAASIILITASFLIYNYFKRGNYLILAILLALSVYTINLTTTKTMIVSLFFVVLMICIPLYLCRWFVKGTLVFCALFSYFFMFGTPSLGYYDNDNTFLIRMYRTWPTAISILDNEISLVIGKGFGAIGTPAYLFNLKIASPADNMFVYFYVIFGLLSVVFFSVFYIKLLLRKSFFVGNEKKYLILLFIIFMGALTYNLIESTVYAAYGGVVMGVIWFLDKKIVKNISKDNNKDGL
ncbi:Uncharacterised protein [Klebsiella pneumoniae]|uniref:hypothetical protein n=1 Tax=Klebsiella pneumoniae TaxID=573 RepID=UPI000DE67F00|nr:hypothetical protein [Klebsiella pneumoniae]SSL70032.1 Uncharacterised protein [Klebsiella pneumoniae]SXP30792.1 Uncharacterised protein [Klebsiella pneumoniae]HBS7467680.1 hypothetical protein [Klebsiella pneumoniae]HCB0386967.1 hypothetical protein [Klebsiella pneumoniae]